MLQRERVLEALAALGRIRPEERETPQTSASDDGAPDSPLPRILGGEWRETQHGRAFVKDTVLPLEHLHGSLPLRTVLEAPHDALAAVVSDASPPPASRLAFFDTETTGLSGGTGTYIFLAGLGWFEDGVFRLRQYFLPALDGERAMLALLATDIARSEGIVTYNGRAFDMPLLETRRTLSRLREEGRMPHFDILRAVRRLYRHRFESCRLAEVESRLLGFERKDDVPGSVIPSLYFDYIRAGRISPLRGVLRHNALDILSLAGVLGFVTRLFAHDDPEPEDAVAIARWWELERQPARAARLYRSALSRLENAALSPRWVSATSRYATLLKRNGERAEAVLLWQHLWSHGDLQAGLELAKHLEHVAKDFVAAEKIARSLLEKWPERDATGRQAVEHRLRRLVRNTRPLGNPSGAG